MGIFSSKKKHFVDTQVARVVEDEFIPNAAQDALFKSIFSEVGLTTAIKNEALNGGFRNFNKMYRFAEKDRYAYGLPNAAIVGSSDGFPLAQQQIETEVGAPVDLEYLHFRPLNNIHQGWKHITDNLGYDYTNNQITGLSTEKGSEVYLEKLVAVHSTEVGRGIEVTGLGSFQSSSFSGFSPETPATALKALVAQQEIRYGAAENESVEIHYIWIQDDEIVRESVVLDLSSFDTDREFYQAKYTYVESTVTKTGYWTYDTVTGSNNQLNGVYAKEYTDPGTYFPIVPFRSEGQNMADPSLHETEEYLSTVKLLEYINIDYQEFSDAMHEDPDIGNVDQAVMMMGVPINAEHQTDIEYLFRYFKGIIDQLPPEATRINYDEPPNLESERFGFTAAPDQSYALQISDADFRTTLSFDKVRSRLRAGDVAGVGEFTNTLANQDITSGPVRNDDITDGIDNLTQRVLQHQLMPGVYEEIIVHNINIRYDITSELGTEGGGNDDVTLIPIDYEVANQMPVLARQEIYYRSLHLVFNSHVIQTVKWYQRGAFKILLTVAALIVTLLTYGVTWKSFVAALANATASTAAAAAFLKFVLVEYIKSYVVQFAFTELIEEIGIESALWLAIAAATVGVYKAFDAGKIVQGSLADNLITASNGLVTGAQNVLRQEFSKYQADLEAFELYKDEQIEELEEIQKLLNTNAFLDPFTFIGRQPMVLFGENPDAYFNRTVHSGNVGMVSINIIQNFVENSLTLPRMHETVGETING